MSDTRLRKLWAGLSSKPRCAEPSRSAAPELQVSPQESRRAFALNVANGALFGFAETLMDSNMVLVWFLSSLTNSNLLLGLLSPIATGGWFLPQLFLAGWVQQKPCKIVVYRLASLVRLLMWGVLVATMWFFRDPVVLLVVFYLAYVPMRVSAGMGGIPFLDVTAKTVPLHWRGRLFGMRMLFGGLLGLFGSRIVRHVLASDLAYPRNYALLVFSAMIAGGLGMLAFSLVREPPGTTRPPTPLGDQLRRGWAAFRENENFRNLLVGRGLLLLGMVVIPFYTVLAQRDLAAPERAVGDYLLVLTITRLAVNYPWGWLADTRGLRWVARFAALGWGLTAAAGLVLLVLAGRAAEGAVAFPAYLLAYPLFVLVGIFTPADSIAGQNLILRVAPEDDRPLYLGFANTFFGVLVLLSGLGGALVDWLGLGAIFGFAVAVNLAAFVLLGRIPKEL